MIYLSRQNGHAMLDSLKSTCNFLLGTKTNFATLLALIFYHEDLHNLSLSFMRKRINSKFMKLMEGNCMIEEILKRSSYAFISSLSFHHQFNKRQNIISKN
jgi:hypothetical protein